MKQSLRRAHGWLAGLMWTLSAAMLMSLAVSRADKTGNDQPAPTAKKARPAPLPDAPETAATGLMLTFETLRPGPDGPVAGAADSRSARLVALYVPAGAPPTPFLPAGAFRATWEGDLNLDIRDDYKFSASGRGSFRLTINGAEVLAVTGEDWSKTVSDTVTLNKGRNRLVAHYESPAAGDAVARLYWASEEFAAEPLPPTLLTHNDAARKLRVARQAREGRELFAALRCASCHLPGETIQPTARPMPELKMDAPSLAAAGARLNEDWMARWIQNPRALRPQATMPAVLTGADAGQDARDIAAFLATLAQAAADPPPGKAHRAAADAVAAGARLFVTHRCIGCHSLPDQTDSAGDQDRIPLRHTRAKWKPEALREFLRKPSRHYAWIAMPDFQFTEKEAANLAAFLLSGEQTDIEPPGPPAGPPDVQRGRNLVVSTGCMNCHSFAPAIEQTANTFAAPALAALRDSDWTGGCMAAGPDARGRAPDFGLTASQQQTLVAFAASDWSSLGREALPEVAERQMRWLRCNACHEWDGRPDRWSKFFEETAALEDAMDDEEEMEADNEFADLELEQIEPVLTWVGEKLRPEWTTRLLRGELEYKARPWLRAPMPAFPAYAEALALGLAMQHGVAPASQPLPAPDAEMARTGRHLVAGDNGFKCNACHGIGAEKATAVFEAAGINFAHTVERLRKQYYHRWMLNPMRVEPQSRMPQFLDAGASPFREIYDGDGHRQMEAIWQYLLEVGVGPAQPDPSK
jgi:cbb3-type cytochrome oxidase cytochrome c subunit